MRSVSLYKAKTQFSKLLDEVAEGESITITRHGVPVAQLRPAGPQRSQEEIDAAIEALRTFGCRHQITLGEGLTIRDLIEEGHP